MEIVGFKQKVDDDINKRIAKFVGMPVHPVAVMLKPLFEQSFIWLPCETGFSSSVFLWFKNRCCRCCAPLEGDEMVETHFNLSSYCIDDGPNFETEESDEEYQEYLNEQRVNLEGWG